MCVSNKHCVHHILKTNLFSGPFFIQWTILFFLWTGLLCHYIYECVCVYVFFHPKNFMEHIIDIKIKMICIGSQWHDRIIFLGFVHITFVKNSSFRCCCRRCRWFKLLGASIYVVLGEYFFHKRIYQKAAYWHSSFVTVAF